MFVLMRLKEDGNLVPPVGTNCICNPSHVTKVLKEFWKDSPTEQIVVISLNSAGQSGCNSEGNFSGGTSR